MEALGMHRLKNLKLETVNLRDWNFDRDGSLLFCKADI